MFLHKLWYHKGSTRISTAAPFAHTHTHTLQFTQEQVVNTTRQSTTTSLVENAIYTTTIEVTHILVNVLLVVAIPCMPGILGNFEYYSLLDY